MVTSQELVQAQIQTAAQQRQLAQQRTALTSQQALRTASRQQMLQLKTTAGRITSGQAQLAQQQKEIGEAIPIVKQYEADVKQYEAAKEAERVRQDAIQRDLALLKQYAEASGQRGSLIYDSSVGSIMQGLQSKGVSLEESKAFYEGTAASQAEYQKQAYESGIRQYQAGVIGSLPKEATINWGIGGTALGFKTPTQEAKFIYTGGKVTGVYDVIKGVSVPIADYRIVTPTEQVASSPFGVASTTKGLITPEAARAYREQYPQTTTKPSINSERQGFFEFVTSIPSRAGEFVAGGYERLLFGQPKNILGVAIRKILPEQQRFKLVEESMPERIITYPSGTMMSDLAWQSKIPAEKSLVVKPTLISYIPKVLGGATTLGLWAITPAKIAVPFVAASSIQTLTNPQRTYEEKVSAGIQLGVVGAIGAYSAVKWAKAPKITTSTVEILPEKISRTKGINVETGLRYTYTNAAGKTIIKDIWDIRATKQVFGAGRVTQVTSNIRNLVGAKPIYEGIPYADKTGYQKAFQYLTKERGVISSYQYYSPSQAKEILRYYKPIAREINVRGTATILGGDAKGITVTAISENKPLNIQLGKYKTAGGKTEIKFIESIGVSAGEKKGVEFFKFSTLEERAIKTKQGIATPISWRGKVQSRYEEAIGIRLEKQLPIFDIYGGATVSKQILPLKRGILKDTATIYVKDFKGTKTQIGYTEPIQVRQLPIVNKNPTKQIVNLNKPQEFIEVYHATPKENIPGILKEGLIAGKAKGVIGSNDKVFTAIAKKTAEGYQVMGADREILTIRVPKEKFFEAVRKEGVGTIGQVKFDSIPKEWIVKPTPKITPITTIKPEIISKPEGYNIPTMVGGRGLVELPKPAYGRAEAVAATSMLIKTSGRTIPPIKLFSSTTRIAGFTSTALGLSSLTIPRVSSKIETTLKEQTSLKIDTGLKIEQVSNLRTSQAPALKTLEITSLKVEQVPSLKVGQISELQLKTISVPSSKFTPEIKTPKIIVPPPTIKIPIPTTPMSLYLRKIKKRKTIFEAFSKRFGKELSLGKYETQTEAERRLGSYLRGTLAASGKIKQEGIVLPFKALKSFRSMEFRPANKDAFTVVQRRAFRLGTGTERREIKLAKRKLKVW